MASFLRPTRLHDVLAALAATPRVILAGGTDHFPARAVVAPPEDILDISALPGLAAIERRGEHWFLPCLATWTDLLHTALPAQFDALKLAAVQVGGRQVQNAGTIVGNLCNASPAADGIPCLLALDAVVELASMAGRRLVPIADFLHGPRRTDRRADEFVLGLRLPHREAARSVFAKLGGRRHLVISITMVALNVICDHDGTITHARVAVGACGPTATRLPLLEAALLGRLADPDLVQPEHLAPLRPIDDGRASAEYRLAATLEILRRTLADLAIPAAPRAIQTPARFPPAAPGVGFVVNDVPITREFPPATRLADVLRDELHLTGTKIGCNAGDCGACTVLIDGQQACACLVPMAQVEGRRITTVEGLAHGDLQRAFLRHGAAQCGICTPAMLIAATDLLARHPAPDEAAIEAALGGVLCRCTGYRPIIDAIRDLAAREACPPGTVGTRLPRIDGAARLDGTEVFGADTRLPPGTLSLRAVRSPHPHARFTLGNLAPVMAAHPGLVRILTAADVPGDNRYGIYPTGKDQPVLADGTVRHRGEPVIALLGDPATLAAIGDDALPITWHVLPEVTAANAADMPELHPHAPGNVLCRGIVARGDLAAGFARATASAEIEVATGWVEHAYVEPEAGFAQRIGDRIEVTACTQTPYMDRDELALILGLRPDQVRVIPTAVGGGFGGKLDLSVQPLLALAAWLTGQPVRWVYTRPESMAATTKRHPAHIAARAAADAQGRLRAFAFHGDYDTGAYASWGPTVANRVPVHATGPYRVAALRCTTAAIHTNGPPSGAFRGFGVPQAAIAGEALMDMLAGQLGLDAWTIRRINALGPGDPTSTGHVLGAGAALPACLDAIRSPWLALREAAATFNATPGPRRQGVGLACMWYGIGNTSMSNPSEMRMGIRPDGRAVLLTGAVDIGQGSNTVMAQIAATALGIDARDLVLVTGDTDRTPDAGKTSASRQTFVSGNAARLAGEALRADILRLANAGPASRITLGSGTIRVTDATDTVLDLAGLAVDAAGFVFSASGRYDPPTTPLDDQGQGEPYASYAFAAQAALVDVDVVLGMVQCRRIVAAHDVGRAINPTLVEGQITGGIAQGLGLALMEEYLPGRTDNLHDYLIPTFGDVPPIETILVEQPDPLGPYGAKGVGEPALVATAPAILNAIADATGARLTRVPATPERVLAALRAVRP